MEPFRRLTGLAAPMPAANVDTDIIFPARFLLMTEKAGLGRYAFYEWRYGPGDAPNPEFVLNQPAYRDAPILVVGDNFGSGSSREQACWALRDMGVRVLVSTRFGEIFYANCFKNGMAPIVVSAPDLKALMADAAAGERFTVDLERQTLARPGAQVIDFEVEAWRREALLNGWDDTALILNRSRAAIDAYEMRARACSPWLFQGE